MLTVVFILVVVVVAGFIARGFNPISNQYRELSRGDKQLINFAMNLEGLNTEQQAYIAYMGRQLISYNLGFTNNILVYQLLAFLILSANYISVGLTGTDYMTCSDAKSLSFAINLIAALFAGISQFFVFDKNAEVNQVAASMLRWEFWQFIGASQEYQGLASQDRYNMFTSRTDLLTKSGIEAQQQLNKHRRQAEAKAQEEAEKAKND